MFIHFLPTKSLTHKEPILHRGIATGKVNQTINNLVLFCASFLHEIQACDILSFINFIFFFKQQKDV